MSDESTPTPGDAHPRPARADHAARRMLATTIVITLAIVTAVVAWTVLRDDPESAASASTGWQQIVLVDPVSGAVTVYESDGTLIERTTGTGRVLAVHDHDGHLALVGATEILVGSPTPIAVPIDAGSVVQPLETATSLHLLVGSAEGGNLLIVDVADGRVIDVGALAAPTVPRLFVDSVRADDTGTRFAVADTANFQTIVVGTSVDGAAFLADRPIAVGAELVATSQTVNQEADVALVHLDRRNEALVPTEIPVGGVMVGDELVMVSSTGGVHRIAAGDRESERAGSVSIPSGDGVTSVTATGAGTRLVVAGATFQAVIDLDGTTVFSTTFGDAVPTPSVRPGWRCLPVGGGTTWHSIVDLSTGTRVADLTGDLVTGVSDDGCTVVVQRDGVFEVVGAPGRVRIGQLAAVTVAPDATTLIWTTTTGRTELVPLGDDLTLGSPVELVGAPTTPTVTFR
jgi:hypothetical protein